DGSESKNWSSTHGCASVARDGMGELRCGADAMWIEKSRCGPLPRPCDPDWVCRGCAKAGVRTAGRGTYEGVPLSGGCRGPACDTRGEARTFPVAIAHR